MKIAQIAPLMERVPPKLYGGTERIVSYLTDALVAQGHNVTLFASSDSITTARLVPCTAQALRLNPAVRDPTSCTFTSTSSISHVPRPVQLHADDAAWPPGLCPTSGHLYESFREMPLVSVSEAQRQPITEANFMATVPHGIPRDLLPPALVGRGGYLAFLGRISPE